MINITRDTASTVVTTFGQSAGLDNPYYLLKIESNFNESFPVEYLALTDLSINPDVYNEFLIDLDIPRGEYTYYVFECVTATPVDEDDAFGSYIETGLLIVNAVDDVTTDIYL